MKATGQLHGYGKVTIPATIRKALDVEDGDLVEIDVQPVEKEGDQ